MGILLEGEFDNDNKHDCDQSVVTVDVTSKLIFRFRSFKVSKPFKLCQAISNLKTKFPQTGWGILDQPLDVTATTT
jgi:hypothetical protein